MNPLRTMGCLLLVFTLSTGASHFTATTHLSPAPSTFPEISGGESIEWLAYDCDLIVRGSVVEVREVSRSGDTFWAEVTVSVKETPKGTCEEQVTFVSIFWDHSRKAHRWQRDKVERLFFLVEAERYKDNKKLWHESYSSVKYALTRHGWFREYVVRLDGKAELGVFDAEFNHHTDRKGILSATQAAISAMDKTKPTAFSVGPPECSPAHLKLNRGSGVSFVLPLDEAMHKRVRKWIVSKNWNLRVYSHKVFSHFEFKEDTAWLRSMHPKVKNPEFRSILMTAIKSTKNDEHVALVRAMLEDSSFRIKYRVVNGKQQEIGCTFPIRAQAYDLLKSWNVEVEKPILQKPKPKRPKG